MVVSQPRPVSLGFRAACVDAHCEQEEGKMRNCLIAVALVALLVLPAGAQYLEYQGAPLRDPIPPNGEPWHELYPNFCVIHPQDNYEDNGDGIVSVCDVVTFGGTRYHVDWVGPTYIMECIISGEIGYFEPTEIYPEGDPTGQMWHQVYPCFCMEGIVQEWEDNGDGILSPCDILLVSGIEMHLQEIALDIEVSEVESPVEQTTWGKIKDFFGNLTD